MRINCLVFVALLIVSAPLLVAGSDVPYDPLFDRQDQPAQTDLTVKDPQKRSLISRSASYLPQRKRKTPAPVVLFSHGLGGSQRKARRFLAVIGRRVVMWRCFCNTGRR